MLLVIISVALAGALSVASTQNVPNCGEPPDVEHASVSQVTDQEYSVGTIVTYTCDNGYTFSGQSRTIFCDRDDFGDGARWTQLRFFCAPQSCGDPGYIDDGRRVGSRFTFPNFVKYECDDGFKIKGIPTRYCQTSGLWSGKLPTCEIVTCSQPEDIPNARVIYKTLEYGSEIKYVCNEGFKLNTDKEIYCTEDGQWSETNVECIESTCDIPVPSEYGAVRLSVPDQVPRSGTIAYYTCEGDMIPYGANTSKCLDDGQWLFPPPECLPPCTVPKISNGNIGRYQRSRYGHYTFYKISAGERIEEDEELVLRCSLEYEVASSQSRETKLFCSRGKWSLEPHCKPASCQSDPPVLENAEVVDINREHGSKVTYHCLKNFKKIADENVVCEFGHWKGASNICQSTRCLRNKLDFPGLRKRYKASYEDGDLFEIACHSGYQLNKEAELTCSEGEWKTNVPPCVAAECPEPPTIPYAKVEKESTAHGSYLTFTCEEPYRLIGSPRVKCMFGKWKDMPRCDDGRCDINDLTSSSYIARQETPRYVQSGQELLVTCKAGYTPRWVKPLCLDGMWQRDSRSPCREQECVVPKVHNGDITDIVLEERYFDIWSLKMKQKIHYSVVPYGTIDNPSTTYLLQCHAGYTFQGSSETSRKITCTKAKWYPDPVCLLPGTDYGIWISKSGVTDTFNKTTTNIIPETTPAPATTESQKTSDSVDMQPEAVTSQYPTDIQCSCQYSLDDETLVATVDGKRLRYLDEVSEGSVVVFRCEHIGIYRFAGPREIKCENCGKWLPSEFPTCSKPLRNDTVIVFQKEWSISADGSLEVMKGQNLTLWCIAYEGGTYPSWFVPSRKRVTFSKDRKHQKGSEEFLYISHLNIESTALENAGEYNCSIENDVATMSSVSVIVIDPNMQCPELPADDEIHISYDNERRVNSKATFSCKYVSDVLDGKQTIRCLIDGNWSDPPSQCHQRKCAVLKETEQLKITYLKDREIGGTAEFHCIFGTVRTGAAFVTCMEDGSWSQPPPVCEYPPCALEDLRSLLPQNVKRHMPNVESSTLPYNSELTLICEDGLVAHGNPIAKCEKNKTWHIQTFHCRSGCSSIKQTPGSNLKMEPVKDIYNFGDYVTLSCPSGMKLTMELQVIMCMQDGWSETILPDCKEDKKSRWT